MIINKRVTFKRQAKVFDFASGSPELVNSRINVFDSFDDFDGWKRTQLNLEKYVKEGQFYC